MPIPPLPRAGASFASAIPVRDVGDEYAWVERAYPGATRILQMLAHEDGRQFDILTLELTSGEWRRVYFDVTDLFASMQTPRSDNG